MHFITSLATVLALINSTAMAQSMDTIDLSLQYNKIVVAHLAFMILTFLVLAPAAILIARFGRTYFQWYHYHRNIQLVTIIFLIIGFALGISAAYPSPIAEQTHYKVGVTVFILFFVQVALGLGAHKYVRKTGHRYLGFIHAPLGLIIFGLAFWNMETGWNIWGSGYVAGKAPRDVLYAWMGLLVLLYLIGLTLIPREIKQSRRQKQAGEKDIEPTSTSSGNGNVEEGTQYSSSN